MQQFDIRSDQESVNIGLQLPYAGIVVSKIDLSGIYLDECAHCTEGISLTCSSGNYCG